MKVLMIAEHDNQSLKSATSHTVTAALELGDSIDVLVIGYQCVSVAEQACLFPHINRVLLADDQGYQRQMAENCAALVADLARGYDYLIVGATTFGKNLLPRIAALLDVAMLSDITKVVSPDTFVRPIYAGNILATVQLPEKLKLLTVRATAFVAAEMQSLPSCTIEKVSKVIPNHLSRFETQSLTLTSRPELTSARVVVSGGRGLKSADNFKLIEQLADQLGAAVGASRAAVDAGFVPNDYQVGQTGKIVAPDLYIAVGISGAIQHLAGMKDSKVIVAINNDPDAPIFQEADYILEGDLFKILPELNAELSRG